MLPSARPVSLTKPLEYSRQKFRRHAWTSIFDLDLSQRSVSLKVNIDHSTCGRKLHRIRKQVPEHLLQSFAVRSYNCIGRGDMSSDSNLLCFRSRLNSINSSVDYQEKINGLRADPELARNDPRHVQQIFNNLPLRSRISLDHFHCVFFTFGVELSRVQQSRPS